MDKYNERYENIAPTNKTHKIKDGASRKQKINQRSRSKKQSGKRETEAQKEQGPSEAHLSGHAAPGARAGAGRQPGTRAPKAHEHAPWEKRQV